MINKEFENRLLQAKKQKNIVIFSEIPLINSSAISIVVDGDKLNWGKQFLIDNDYIVVDINQHPATRKWGIIGKKVKRNNNHDNNLRNN